jgi:glycosyltransferase involved in cell wall biosynthesis
MNTQFPVYVSCPTYNQAAYIKDTLDGFCMQETSFPFICGIIDDASTDGEQAIIQRYLDENFDIEKNIKNDETEDYVRRLARHKINKNCFFIVVFLKYNHYQIKKSKVPYVAEWRNNAKYMAICEGDDYWIDPSKLQKQYDFLENNTDCSLCFHADVQLYPNGNRKETRPSTIKTFYSTTDAILGGGGFMATNSMFYRNSFFLDEETPLFIKNCPVGDLPNMLYLASKGKIGYINETLSVYRVTASGSWTSGQNTIRVKWKHHKSILNMLEEYDEYTNYRYHSAINRKKRINKKNFYTDCLIAFIKFVLHYKK